MKVQSLFNALTQSQKYSNKPYITYPIEQKLLDKLASIQENNLANNMILSSQNDKYGVKDASEIKAELIRRNLLSRKDLMQLYRPPMKKS